MLPAPSPYIIEARSSLYKCTDHFEMRFCIESIDLGYFIQVEPFLADSSDYYTVKTWKKDSKTSTKPNLNTTGQDLRSTRILSHAKQVLDEHIPCGEAQWRALILNTFACFYLTWAWSWYCIYEVLKNFTSSFMYCSFGVLYSKP